VNGEPVKRYRSRIPPAGINDDDDIYTGDDSSSYCPLGPSFFSPIKSSTYLLLHQSEPSYVVLSFNCSILSFSLDDDDGDDDDDDDYEIHVIEN
jgi:hypothetical protein